MRPVVLSHWPTRRTFRLPLRRFVEAEVSERGAAGTAPDLAALRPSQFVGRYRIVSVLGQGGFGITYRAVDFELGRHVGIKEYLPAALAVRQDGTTVLPRSNNAAQDFAWRRDRFMAEGRTLAALHRAPGIVLVHDFLEANGTAGVGARQRKRAAGPGAERRHDLLRTAAVRRAAGVVGALPGDHRARSVGGRPGGCRAGWAVRRLVLCAPGFAAASGSELRTDVRPDLLTGDARDSATALVGRRLAASAPRFANFFKAELPGARDTDQLAVLGCSRQLKSCRVDDQVLRGTIDRDLQRNGCRLVCLRALQITGDDRFESIERQADGQFVR
jgi:hypothetical protein